MRCRPTTTAPDLQIARLILKWSRNRRLFCTGSTVANPLAGGFSVNRDGVFEKRSRMSILSRLASAQGRKDEDLNKELARELVEKNDAIRIQEVAEGLWSED